MSCPLSSMDPYWDCPPSEWAKHHPAANGPRQSPINIEVAKWPKDPELSATAKFNFNYNKTDSHSLVNRGTQWQITMRPESTTQVQVNFLPDHDYKVLQTHAHWNSEHAVDGKELDGEIHIVHQNTKYPDPGEAAKHGDGFMVLGIFMKLGDSNPAIEPIVQSAMKTPFKNDEAILENGFNLESLIPQCRDFWTYDGSLTTPPCSECVQWVVFRHPISISAEQLNVFKSLHIGTREEDDKKPRLMSKNTRPPVPLNDRKVRACINC